MGRYPVPPGELLGILGSRLGLPISPFWTEAMEAAVWNIRLPRVLLSVLVGGCLAAAGAAYQGVFQNPWPPRTSWVLPQAPASAVSVSGMIGWVGLVIPHMMRRLVGSDYRYLMPASILGGGLFLLLVDDVVPHGNGNETDLEQIMLWDPEVIFFDPASIYAEVGSMEAWQSVTAIRTGAYYEAPYGPYGWLSSPPAVQRYLGLLWLGQVLYPEYVEYALQEEVTEYYRLFYNCELTDEMYRALMENSLP